MTKRHNEFRLDEDGKLDDVVVWDAELVRLERMDTNSWWLGVTLRDGSRVMFNIGSKRAAVEATHWFDRVSAPATKKRRAR